jgi:hypothetical protein
MDPLQKLAVIVIGVGALFGIILWLGESCRSSPRRQGRVRGRLPTTAAGETALLGAWTGWDGSDSLSTWAVGADLGCGGFGGRDGGADGGCD